MIIQPSETPRLFFFGLSFAAVFIITDITEVNALLFLILAFYPVARKNHCRSSSRRMVVLLVIVRTI